MGQVHAQHLTIFTSLFEVARAALGGDPDEKKKINVRDMSSAPPEVQIAELQRLLGGAA